MLADEYSDDVGGLMADLKKLGENLTAHDWHSINEEPDDQCLECTCCHCCGEPIHKHKAWFKFPQSE